MQWLARPLATSVARVAPRTRVQAHYLITCKNLALYIRDCVSLCLSDETLKAVGPFSVFCPGLKKGTVLLEEKGHFCSRNYILRALSRA